MVKLGKAFELDELYQSLVLDFVAVKLVLVAQVTRHMVIILIIVQNKVCCVSSCRRTKSNTN